MNLSDYPLAMTVSQLCEAMINSGEIAPVIRSGRMVRVPRHVVERMLGLDHEAGTPTVDADVPGDHATPSRSNVRTLGRGSG